MARKQTKTPPAAAPAVGDARFQKVHHDPRFARLSKKKNKLQIDERFAAVLKDDKFQTVQGKYDKYGRRIDKKNNELKKFYRLEEEEEAEEVIKDAADSDEDEEEEEEEEEEKEPSKSKQAKGKGKAKAKTMDASSSEEDADEEDGEGEEDSKMSRLEYLNRMARGELPSDSSDESDMDDADLDVDEEEAEKEDIPMGDETKRFAMLNCDWSRLRAVDLFALCESFAPATGTVKDVTVYPSDYGLQKMKEEEQHGPRGLWADKEVAETAENSKEGTEEEDKEDKEGKDDQDDEEEDAEEEGGYDLDDPLGVKKRVTAADEDGFDPEKLRKYELQKLKYYYAVVTCDSVKTASAIYENCDQLEYETSSNLLDLRYVPDDMEFTNPPRDSCQRVPDTYKPAIFATAALQNTDVALTWEQDDDHRQELLTRQTEWKTANDDDFAAYLASENSSSEEEGGDSDDGEEAEEQEEQQENVDEKEGASKTKSKSRADKKKAAKLKKIKNRYRQMLLGSDAEDSEDDERTAALSSDADMSGSDAEVTALGSDDNDSDDDGEGNMEMSFTPGASDVLRAKRQKELEANETPFERYAREKKLEKNKKKHDKRTQQKALEREQREMLKKSKGRGKAPEQLQALRAAIDGTGVDDENPAADDDDRDFDMARIAQSEKAQRLRGKRRAKELRKLGKGGKDAANKPVAGLQQGFAFDAVDPRFKALYETGSQFQLDPTDPKFKKSEATQAIFQERRKRQHNHEDGGRKAQPQAASDANGATADKNDSRTLQTMVANLKRKAPKAAASSTKPKPFKKSKM